MKAKILLIFGLLIVALVSAVVHLPASIVTKIVTLPGNIRLYGVSGTLWHGEINNLQVSGISLGKVLWKVEPGSVLGGELDASVRFGEQSAIQARGKGILKIMPSSIGVSQLSMTMPARQLSPWIQLPLPLTMAGDLSLLVTEYQFSGSLYCEQLNGQLSWNQAKVEFLSNQLDLGEARASLGCQAQQIIAQTTQKSDQLSSQFSLKLSTPNRYQLSGWFAPAAGFPEALRSQLTWLPAPDGQNRYQIKKNGRY